MITEVKWRRSSRSAQGATCVEVAEIGPRLAVRDSKDPAGPVLLMDAAGRALFFDRVRCGVYDLDIPSLACSTGSSTTPSSSAPTVKVTACTKPRPDQQDTSPSPEPGLSQATSGDTYWPLALGRCDALLERPDSASPIVGSCCQLRS